MKNTHYYPFGLTMAGISSKTVAFGGAENKKKFNGIEHTTDLDLNQYDAFYRTFDPQLGRFWQVDPKVDSMFNWSPYVAMFDNPIKFMDPLGDSSKPTNTQQAYYPAPKTLPGFPDAGKRTYNKESGRYRWKQEDGSILEWDKRHGEVEKYDKSGKNHQGSFDPNTGEQIKPGDGRTTPKVVPTETKSPPKAAEGKETPKQNIFWQIIAHSIYNSFL
jgi:RHS repeat-associated protein